MALEKRDGTQWRNYLTELARSPEVGSRRLLEAAERWKVVLDEQPVDWLETMGVPSRFSQDAALGRAGSLFEKRLDAYKSLLPLTEYGSEDSPRHLRPDEKKALADRLRAWYYQDGAGLLLSGRAHKQFQQARQYLDEDRGAVDVNRVLSKLRTDFKIDLGVRQPQERDVALAWPEEERW
jgi:hypothetical protein